MANVLISEDTMTDIADAIREKTEKTGLLKPGQMPVEIRSIPGGSGKEPVPEKDVCFYDYDGTRVYSYTLTELQAMESLPAPPVHEGLISQGWNWTLEGLKNQNSIMDVGSVYITDDGSTRLYIRLYNGRTKPTLRYDQSKTGGSLVDWGDGSSPEIATDMTVIMTHVYPAAGDYMISIQPIGNDSWITIPEGGYSNILINGTALMNSGLYYCDSILSIEIGKNISISGGSFSDILSLRTITIPKGTSIGDLAFKNNNALECVVIPSKEAGNSISFEGAPHLRVVCMPEGLKRIRNSCFSKCSRIKRVCIPDTVNTLGTSVFSSCKKLEAVRFPSGLKTIPSSSFSSCNCLKNINIPTGLTSIGDDAFACIYGVTEIHLPDSLQSIGFEAFSCVGLTRLYVHATVPPTITDTTFRYNTDEFKIYVPHGCLEVYKNANKWVDLSSHLVEMDE